MDKQGVITTDEARVLNVDTEHQRSGCDVSGSRCSYEVTASASILKLA